MFIAGIEIFFGFVAGALILGTILVLICWVTKTPLDDEGTKS